MISAIEDYNKLLDEVGITQSMVESSMAKISVKNIIADGLEIRKSNIAGDGVFATKFINFGTPFLASTVSETGVQTMSLIGKYTNHSPKSNCMVIFNEKIGVLIVAKDDIREGEELTLNYRQVNQMYERRLKEWT